MQKGSGHHARRRQRAFTPRCARVRRLPSEIIQARPSPAASRRLNRDRREWGSCAEMTAVEQASLLPIPVIALVLAFTAVPTELRSLSHHRIRDFFGIGFEDFVANLVGSCAGWRRAREPRDRDRRSDWRPQCLSSRKAMQLFSEGRSSQVTDVAANVIGAALGVALYRRLKIDLSRDRRRQTGCGLGGYSRCGVCGLRHGD